MSFELRHPNKLQCYEAVYVKSHIWFDWLIGCMPWLLYDVRTRIRHTR